MAAKTHTVSLRPRKNSVTAKQDYEVGDVVHESHALAWATRIPRPAWDAEKCDFPKSAFFDDGVETFRPPAGLAISILDLLYGNEHPDQDQKELSALWMTYTPRYKEQDLVGAMYMDKIKGVVRARTGSTPTDHDVLVALKFAAGGGITVNDLTDSTCDLSSHAFYGLIATCIEHSCLPNTHRIHTSPTDIKYICIRPIAKGEKLTTCVTSLVMSPTERYLTRDAVNEQLGYECDCDECKKPADNEKDLVRSFWSGACQELVALDLTLEQAKTKTSDPRFIGFMFGESTAEAAFRKLNSGHKLVKADMLLLASILKTAMSVTGLCMLEDLQPNAHVLRMAHGAIHWMAHNNDKKDLALELVLEPLFQSAYACACVRTMGILVKKFGMGNPHALNHMQKARDTIALLRMWMRHRFGHACNDDMIWFNGYWNFGPMDDENWQSPDFKSGHHRHSVYAERIKTYKAVSQITQVSERVGGKPLPPIHAPR